MHRADCPFRDQSLCPELSCCVYRDLRLYFGLPFDVPAPQMNFDLGIEGLSSLISEGSRFALEWSNDLSHEVFSDPDEMFSVMQARDQAISEQVIGPFSATHLSTFEVLQKRTSLASEEVSMIPAGSVFMSMLGASLHFSSVGARWQQDLFTMLLNFRSSALLAWSRDERLFFTLQELFDLPASVPPLVVSDALDKPKQSKVALGERILGDGVREYLSSDGLENASLGAQIAKFIIFAPVFAEKYLLLPSPAFERLASLIALLASIQGGVFRETGLRRLVHRMRKSQLLLGTCVDVVSEESNHRTSWFGGVGGGCGGLGGGSWGVGGMRGGSMRSGGSFCGGWGLGGIFGGNSNIPLWNGFSLPLPLSEPPLPYQQPAIVEETAQPSKLSPPQPLKPPASPPPIETPQTSDPAVLPKGIFGGIRVMPLDTDARKLEKELSEKRDSMRLGGEVVERVDNAHEEKVKAIGKGGGNFSRAVEQQAKLIDQRRKERIARGELREWEEDGTKRFRENNPEIVEIKNEISREKPKSVLRKSEKIEKPQKSPIPRPSEPNSADFLKEEMRRELIVRALLWRGISRSDAEQMARSFLSRGGHSKQVDGLLSRKLLNNRVAPNEIHDSIGKAELLIAEVPVKGSLYNRQGNAMISPIRSILNRL